MSDVQILCRVQALYSFKSNDPSSLSFQQDDFIDVLSKLPSGWWDGLCNGTRGWFPSNYVKVINQENIKKEENNNYSPSLAYQQKQKQFLTSNESLIEDMYSAKDSSLYDGYESADQLSSIDFSNWSDQSTILSTEEKSHWLNRVTSPRGKYSISDTQSVASKASSIETHINTDTLLSWNKISNQIAVPIYQLTSAAKNGQHELYEKFAAETVNTIRYMLIASSTIDKDSNYVKTNATLRSYHRSMMASMSKLVLSTQATTAFVTEEEQQTISNKILTETNELLLATRNFVNTCQQLKIPLIQTDPQWMQNHKKEDTNRYTLQLNLAETLDTMSTCIQDSLESIDKFIASHLSDEQADRLSLTTVLFTHFKNLSSQVGLFVTYLDDTDFSQVQESLEYLKIKASKESLTHNLGVFFLKLQDLTYESTTDIHSQLKEVELAVNSLIIPIESICEYVHQLANNIINSSELAPSIERHKSESAISQSTPQLPFPMQRSQTSPPKSSNDKLKKFFGDEAPLPEKTKIPDEFPEYLKYDYGPNDLVFTREGQVKGGTLPALVERLTLHDYLDMNFINTFLLTYRSFCSSEELMDLLEARYNLTCPEGLEDEDAIIWEEKKHKLIRLRVFNVLKNWLETYYNEDDSVLLDRLLDFTHTHIRSTLKFSNGQLEALIEGRRNAAQASGLKRMILTLPDPPEPILPKNRRSFKLLDLDPLEMARQLTIMDFKLYSAIRPIECLDKAWSGDEEGNVAVNIRASIEYCNQVTSWVSDVILSQHDIKKRSVLIKYWVQVAEKCRVLNNFNTCMAILSAFDNSSVGRLKRTWEVVGARTNQTLQHIRKLMGANRNFVEYRDFIHSINPPCIPFLGIYLQDLTFIEDGNTNVLKENKSLINFAKRAKTAEVIREIQQYQSSLYQLKPVEEIQGFIKTRLKSTRDEEQLYKESLRLEPREREDEKITRLLQESGFL